MKTFWTFILSFVWCFFAHAEDIDVTCTNLVVDDYTFAYDMFFFTADNDHYYITAGFNAYKIEGVHTMEELSADDTRIYDYETDDRIDFSDITVTMTKAGNRWKAEAEVLGVNGNTYHFHLSYQKPDTGEDIHIDFTETPAQSQYNNYWKSYSISAENEKYIVELELYSGTLVGSFTTSDFDRSYTAVIVQETGERIAPESINATFTRDGDNINIEAVLEGDDGNTYYIKMYVEDPLTEIVDEVLVNIREAVLTDMIDQAGLFQLGGYNTNNEYYVAVGAQSHSVEGFYPAKNLHSMYSYIMQFALDALTSQTYKFMDGSCTIEHCEDWAKCEGELVADNGVKYIIHMETMAERPDGITEVEVFSPKGSKVLHNHSVLLRKNGRTYDLSGRCIE